VRDHNARRREETERKFERDSGDPSIFINVAFEVASLVQKFNQWELGIYRKDTCTSILVVARVITKSNKKKKINETIFQVVIVLIFYWYVNSKCYINNR